MEEKKQFAHLGIDRIEPDPNNANRHSDEELDQLAKNIGIYGLINPVSVTPISPERFRLIAGEGRWRACKRLGWEKIPAIIDFGHKAEETTGKRFSENRLRKSDWVVDCREAARLKKEGLSHEEIAERFGLRRVQDYIAVGFYPKEVWEIINAYVRVYNLMSFQNDISPSLTLRIPPHFEINLRGGKATPLTPADYAKFDYSEVIGYFQKIADGMLDTREKREEYILERRYAITSRRAEEVDAVLEKVNQEIEGKVQAAVQGEAERLEGEKQQALKRKEVEHSNRIREIEEQFKRELEAVSRSDEVQKLRGEYENRVAVLQEEQKENMDALRKEYTERIEAQLAKVTNQIREDTRKEVESEYAPRITRLDERVKKLTAEKDAVQEKLDQLKQDRADTQANREREGKAVILKMDDLTRKLSERFNKVGETVSALDHWDYLSLFTQENAVEIIGAIEYNLVTVGRFVQKLRRIASGEQIENPEKEVMNG